MIGLSGVLALATIMHHPVLHAHDTAGIVAGVTRLAAVDRLVHGVLSASVTVLTGALFYFAAGLGFRRPHVLLGSLCAALSLVLMVSAAVIDGFVTPALVDHCGQAACSASLKDMLLIGGMQIEYLTRFAFVATAASTLLWSGDLLARRIIAAGAAGLIGLVCGAMQLWLVFTDTALLTPRSLLAIVAAQAVWQLTVAALMIGRTEPFADH